MNQPLLVTAAIILDKSNVLLVKRAREPFKGYWSFIGGIGGFEHATDPKEVVKMEVQGDIGCYFDPTFFMYSYEEWDAPSVIFYFHGSITGNLTINPKYVVEYKWMLLKEAVNAELAFDHQAILKKFLQSLRK